MAEMSAQRFRLQTVEDRERILRAIAETPLEPPHVVVIEPKHEGRSMSANAAYWAGTITPAAEQLGYDDAEELHKQVCCKLYGYTQSERAGMITYKPNRTTTTPKRMTKKEFREHMDRAAALLTSWGVALPAFGTWSGM